MKKTKILLLLLPLFLGSACNKINEHDPIFGIGQVRIGNQSVDVEIADTQSAREKGLSGKSHILENQGMIFLFPKPGIYGFWMKGVNFDLDIIWIKDNRVIQITRNVPTEPGVADADLKMYYPDGAVDAVLEMRGRWTAKSYIEVGDSAVLSK